MANLNAYFQFNTDMLNLGWFIENLESFRLDQNVFDPWEDRYSIFTPDEAIVLHGTGFQYDARAQMYQGTVEAFSQWFYDDILLAWTEAFVMSDLNVPALDIYDALQSASTNDDFSLLEQILSGDDMFNLSRFDDVARGYDGSDMIYGRAGADTLYGDAGMDELRGGRDDDLIKGGVGKDILRGGKDDDKLYGGADDDVLKGGSGKDMLFGGRGEDALFGGNDDDVLRGGRGADDLQGGSGDDDLAGGQGADSLFGGNGQDILRGEEGKDALYGGNDDDILRGGADNDVLRGGSGTDILVGGAGEDLFRFKTGDGIDTIKDFELSVLDFDRIDLTGLESVSGWTDLKNNHMTQVGDDVVIDGGDGDMLILSDTDIGDIVKVFFDL